MGTKEGVAFFNNVKKIIPHTTLSITGVCRDTTIAKLIHESNADSHISKDPIPYKEIVDTLHKGGIALLPYQLNTSIQNRIPTKFFEYMYYRIPMVIQKNPKWEEYLQAYKAAIFIDFKNFNIEEVINLIEEFDFYSGDSIDERILWSSEEEKLYKVIHV